MNFPIRNGGQGPAPGVTSSSANGTGSISGSTGTRSVFASKLLDPQSAQSTAAPISGRQIITAALQGKRTLSLENLLPGNSGDAKAQEALKLVDQAKQFALQNAIFDAANAPIVERDLS